VAFAQSLQLHIPQSAVRLAPEKPVRSLWLNLFTMPRLALAGGLAMLLAVGIFYFENPRLNESRNRTATHQAATQQPHAEQPAGTKPTLEAPVKGGSPAQGAVQHLPSVPVSVFAFVLAPQLRGAAQMPTLVLTQNTARVDFRLDLEANDFPHYRVTLKSLKADKSLWQSADLDPVTKADSSTLSLKVPAKLLQQGMYKLDVTGAPANGEAEYVSSYVFRVAMH
jgi:hypothetical protein